MYDYSKTMTGSALGSGGCVGITAEAQRSLTILLEACEKRASSLRSSALLIGDKIEGPQPANPSILDDRAAAPSVYDRSCYDETVNVFHAIEPNHDRDPSRIDAGNKPWRSVWWDEDAPIDQMLRVSGFDEQPFWAPRWDTIDNDAYSADAASGPS